MQTKELKMAGIGFAVFVVVGFFLVGSGKESAEDKATSQMFQAGAMLRSYAMKKCQLKIKPVLNLDRTIGAPDSNVPGDEPEQVNLTWNGDGSKGYKEITCSFKTGKGVRSLVIDGKTFIPEPTAEEKSEEADAPQVSSDNDSAPVED